MEYSFLIQLLATFLGVFLAFIISYLYNRCNEKEIVNNQTISLLSEIKTNQNTINQLRSGIEKGFTLDKFDDSSVDSLIHNPKLFSIYSKHLNLVRLILTYKKVIFIANRMIDFCYECWKVREWERNPELKKIHVENLEKKLKPVEEIGDRIHTVVIEEKLVKLKKK